MNFDSTDKRSAVLKEYSTLAADYDRRWSYYIKETTGRTLCRVPPNPVNILDAGCGTGTLLIRLSETFPEARLSGTDASADMLRVARHRLPLAVSLTEGWVEALGYADNSFDVVTCCNMFHYVRNPEQALAELLRVLKPSGVLVLTDWCRDFWVSKIYHNWLSLTDDAYFHTYSSAQMKNLLVDAGADGIETETYRISWFWGLMTTVARKPSATSTPESAV